MRRTPSQPCWSVAPRPSPGSLSPVDGLNSNLNLNGDASATVIPGLGEWGPVNVPSTRSKKRMRWLISLFFVLALTAVIAFGWWIYTILH